MANAPLCGIAGVSERAAEDSVLYGLCSLGFKDLKEEKYHLSLSFPSAQFLQTKCCKEAGIKVSALGKCSRKSSISSLELLKGLYENLLK